MEDRQRSIVEGRGTSKRLWHPLLVLRRDSLGLHVPASRSSPTPPSFSAFPSRGPRTSLRTSRRRSSCPLLTSTVSSCSSSLPFARPLLDVFADSSRRVAFARSTFARQAGKAALPCCIQKACQCSLSPFPLSRLSLSYPFLSHFVLRLTVSRSSLPSLSSPILLPSLLTPSAFPFSPPPPSNPRPHTQTPFSAPHNPSPSTPSSSRPPSPRSRLARLSSPSSRRSGSRPGRGGRSCFRVRARSRCGQGT